MYRTADNLDDLDIVTELKSFDSIGDVMERHSFWLFEEKYHNADFYLIMTDNSEEDEIRELLNSCGWSAWLDYDDEMVFIG